MTRPTFAVLAALAGLALTPGLASAQCDVNVAAGQSIQTDGVDAAAAGDTVCVAAGTFTENVNVDKQLVLQGVGSEVGDTLLQGQLTIDNVVATSGVPTVIQDIRITNAGGVGISIPSAEWLTLDNVTVVDCGDDGVGVGTSATGFTITGSLFENNAEFGLRGGTATDFDTFIVENSVFRSNTRGGILFHGGSAVNDGSVQNFQVLNTQFISNSPADVTPWGGGIWLKTAGAGSFIDGVLVQGSTFRNNGGSNSLNQVGITIRVRPGTTLSDVTFCDNVFAETADPGTQLTGINVYDETGGVGYEPLLACNNTFDNVIGLDGSEQDSNEGTQPAVEYYGNEAINGGQLSRLVDLQFVGSVLEIPTLDGKALATLAVLLAMAALLAIRRRGL